MSKSIIIYKKLLAAILTGDEIHEFADLISQININEGDRDKRTLLMHAVIRNRINWVKIICHAGADLNLHDNHGWTALHFACQGYHIEIIAFLLNLGADVNVKDENGNTPLWRSVFESKGRGDAIKLLISYEANPNAKNNYDISPYQLACTIANYDVKQYF